MILSKEKQRQQYLVNKIWQQTPKGKYSAQKRKAKQRGIPWEFTFDTWWKVWEDSGMWNQRGDSKGKVCMSRFNDTGAYSPENVYINSFDGNTKEVYQRNGVDSYGRFVAKQLERTE